MRSLLSVDSQDMGVSGKLVRANDARESDARASQLQAVLDHAPDAFVSMARDGRIIEWNLQAERMFGWSRAEALGRTVADLIVPPHARRDRERGLARYLETGEAHALNRPIEFEAVTKAGGLIAVELTIAAVGGGPDTTVNAFLRDISERRAHELALREAEAMFRGAFTDASVGMCLATLDGCRWSQVNPALCALLGYSADQLIGLGFDQVTHPDDREANLEGARRLREGEIVSYETEKRYLHADGHVIWVSLSVSLLRDGDGVARCFIAHVLDITARKTSDEALATSEERFRLMVESVEDYAIFMLDPDGRVATWNAGAQRFKGYRAEEIIGRHFSVFYPPEDVAAGKPERELQIAAAEGRVEDEGWRVTRDGTPFWASVVITALRDAQGTLRGYGKVTRDLTELHAAEQARRAAHLLFETAFADAPIGMALVALDGSWLKVNHELCQIVGWSEAQLLARTFQDITHPDDLDADLAHVAALVRGDGDSYQMDKRYLHRDGHVIWIKLSVRLVRDPSGAPAHFIAQIQDITGSREAQRALARSEARLQAIFEHVPAGMALRDIEGRYEHVNAHVARSLGRQPEQMLGRRAEDLFPELADAVRSQDARLLASGEPLAEEMRVPLGDGTTGDFHVVRYPVRDADGTVTGLGSFSVEITERKRVERELAQERHALAEAQAIAQTGSWQWDVDTDEIAWSDELCRIFGIAVEDAPVTLEAYLELLYPDDRAAAAEAIGASHASGEPFSFTHRILRPDGTVRVLHGDGEVVFGEDGHVRRMLGTAQDVTEREAMADELRRSARYFDLSRDLTVTAGLDGYFKSVNPALEYILGWSAEEFLARPFIEMVHPDDRAATEAEVGKLAEGRITFNFLNRYEAKDGSYRWLDWNAILAPEEKLLYCAARDVTDRKRVDAALSASERQTRQILETAHDAFVAIDAAGVITDWNPRAQEMFGWTRDEALGRDLADTIIPVEHRAAHRSGLRRFVPGRESPVLGRLLELSAVHRDGHEFPVELTISPVETEDGYSFNAFIRDITERHRAQQELASARDQALEASKMKSMFVANVSHEIRTPMNGVLGMSELLLDTRLDAEQREFAEMISSSGEALLEVIDDILDFSKIEAGKLELDPTDFDLSYAVERACGMQAERAHKKGLELVVAIDPELPPLVHGDVARVRQVITNFVSNAIKFTPHGEVVVRASSVDQDAALVRVEVTDTGIGIERDALAQLFKPFSQADTSTTRKYGGTGLGLAISKQLIELMGGSVGAESEPGKGSTFWFEISLPPPAARKAAPAEKRELAGLRVLVVDDNAASRRMLEQQLGKWQMICASAENAATAVGLLESAAESGAPYALALVDRDMPDVDGYELARAIRGQPALSGIQLMLLSPSGTRSSTSDHTFDRVLTKPVRQSRLYEEIQTLIAGRTPVGRRIQTPTAIPAGTTPNDARPEVLVAEDTLVNQAVAVRMIEKCGYRARVAEDGRQALEALAERSYAAVLMDCQMPELDGYETTREIRRSERPWRGVPVIAMTASSMRGEREKCLAAGMNDYLTKPLQNGTLRDTLKRWIAEPGNPPGGLAKTGPLDEPFDPHLIDEAVITELDLNHQDQTELLAMYFDQADNQITELSNAISRGETMIAAQTAHKLKGSSSAIGAARVTHLASELEATASTNNLTNAPALLAKLRSALAETRRTFAAT